MKVIEPRASARLRRNDQIRARKQSILKEKMKLERGEGFWPVKVGEIDIEALKRDRDQLFAEAVAAYRAGEQWWPDAVFERRHIKPEQEARYETDPWEQAILEYVAPLSRVRVTDIARDALHIESIGKIGNRRSKAYCRRAQFQKAGSWSRIGCRFYCGPEERP